MTLFLASIRDADEAEIALRAGADLIDLKEPRNGALGAVPHEAVSAVLAQVKSAAGEGVMTSATVGDLPMQPELLGAAIRQTAALGVDYVKFGITGEGDAESCLAALEPLAKEAKLIVVLFADALPKCDAMTVAAKIGAAGVMLDTSAKGQGSLLDYLHLASLRRFIAAGRAQGLTVGLAGSLRSYHVPYLLALEPDIIGFRGALCEGGKREAHLSEQACRAIRELIPKNAPALPPAQAIVG